MLARLIVLGLLMSLVSCSYISSKSPIQMRDKQYLTARSIPPLKIPPGVSSSAIHSYYPVPNKNYPQSAKTVSVVPPGLYT